MSVKRDERKQKTPEGHETTVPKRGEFSHKVAKIDSPTKDGAKQQRPELLLALLSL